MKIVFTQRGFIQQIHCLTDGNNYICTNICKYSFENACTALILLFYACLTIVLKYEESNHSIVFNFFYNHSISIKLHFSCIKSSPGNKLYLKHCIQTLELIIHSTYLNLIISRFLMYYSCFQVMILNLFGIFCDLHFCSLCKAFFLLSYYEL